MSKNGQQQSLRSFFTSPASADASTAKTDDSFSKAPATPTKVTKDAATKGKGGVKRTLAGADDSTEAEDESKTVSDSLSKRACAASPAAAPAAEKPAEETAGVSSNSVSKREALALKFLDLESLIPPTWREALKGEFTRPYWSNLKQELAARARKGEQIFPPPEKIFAAMDACPFDAVNVVLIGQDPYHDDNQAEGLCFSVPKGIKVPPSLNNMYKELVSDIPGFTKPTHGHLLPWAKQGMLMLNTVLTVKAHEAFSHKTLGWLNFTDAVIALVAEKQKRVVWLCWGQPAQKKAAKVNASENCILACPHPSGLSASKGFFGSKHFSKCNEYLKKEGKPEIKWQV